MVLAGFAFYQDAHCFRNIAVRCRVNHVAICWLHSEQGASAPASLICWYCLLIADDDNGKK